MSEKDELIETITEIVREECIATGRGEDGRDSGELRDDLRDLIDAAVAPLVEALEDCIGMLQSFTGSRYDEEGAVAAQISDAEQALAPWRK